MDNETLWDIINYYLNDLKDIEQTKSITGSYEPNNTPSHARRFYRNNLSNFFERRPNWTKLIDFANYAENWRYRPKGDFASVFGDLFGGMLNERTQGLYRLANRMPNEIIGKYAGELEQLTPPQINRRSILRGMGNVPRGFASHELINGMPGIGQVAREIAGNLGKVAERTAVPLAIYEGLSQPTATDQQMWDDVNRYNLQRGVNLLYGGISNGR